jgi:hypothetical protein
VNISDRGIAGGHERVPARSRWVALFVAAALMLLPSSSSAEDVTVPVSLQAELLVKVAEYDRNFTARAGDRVHVLLVVKPNNADSQYVASQMEAALSRMSQIVGLPHDETIIPYTGAAELAKVCRSRHAAIVFFGPGFRDDIEAIRAELSGVDVLTATGVPTYVAGGVVLGFDVVSGRPKLLVHLTQARRQNVSLRADVLKLMKVFE